MQHLLGAPSPFDAKLLTNEISFAVGDHANSKNRRQRPVVRRQWTDLAALADD